MKILTIEPGVRIDVVNPSWNRTFKVLEKKEQDGFDFWRCEWTGPDPDRPVTEGWEFVGFGVVRHRESGITEAWVISTSQGNPCQGHDLVECGMNEMRRHECGHCHKYVEFKERRIPRGPELIEIRYKCPKCGHVEVDMFD